MFRLRVSLLGFFVLVSTSSHAFGDDAVDAERHFKEGVRLLDDGRFAAAAAELERSLAIRETPSVLYDLALAYRGVGKYRRAIELFQRFLTLATDERHAAEKRDVRLALTELEAALAELKLVVRGRPDSLRVDGEALPVSTRTLKLDPGRHRVELGKRGFRSVVREVELEKGGRASLELRVSERLRAELTVVSEKSADIHIDGEKRGVGMVRLEMLPGRHRIRVSATGRESRERVVLLTPARSQRVEIDPGAEETAITSRWWFWTGAGVLVAGGVATYVILSRDEEPEPREGKLFSVEALRKPGVVAW